MGFSEVCAGAASENSDSDCRSASKPKPLVSTGLISGVSYNLREVETPSELGKAGLEISGLGKSGTMSST